MNPSDKVPRIIQNIFISNSQLKILLGRSLHPVNKDVEPNPHDVNEMPNPPDLVKATTPFDAD
ncbi:MAG: hypothetical protein HOA14_06500 [Planctomycetaceae bacterium]|jgi:hypothetical protein|nr:hypothetical protein [Planctomycetaceae bacterium]